MSTWGKVILTKQGEALLNQCLGMSGHYNLNQSNDPDSDTKGIVITRVSTGRYRYTNTSVEYLKERTDLATSDGATGGTSGFVENLNITGLKPIISSNSDQYGQALIQVQLDNQREDRNIKEEYPLGQLGVFARLEGSTEEILFTIVQYAGDTLPVIPAPVTPTLLNFGFYIAIATTETVSIEMEFTGIVTAKQFDDYKLVTDETLNTLNEHTKNTENPHKVTAQQVGLGNVPNVATNDQTPTFTAASSRTNINSGETLATIFGKIKKWFSDLKTIAFTGSYTDLLNKPTSMQNPNSLTLTMNGSATSYNGSATASKSWYAPTSVGTAGYIPISNGSGAPAWRQPDYYGVCSTEGATRDKVVDIPNFKLVNGVRIRVKFTYSHAMLASGTNARLNVSNTGAKTVYLANKLVRGYYGVPNASSADTSMYPNTWDENEVIEFWYDGSSWRSIPETHILDPLDVKLVRASWVTWNTAGNTTYLPKFLNKIIRSCDFFADSSNAASIIQEALRHTANAGRLSIITTYGNSYFTIDDNIYIAESQTESSLRAPRKVTIEGRSMVSTSKARLDFKNNCSIKNGGATSPQLTLKNLELQLYRGIGVGVQNTTFINLGTGNGSVLILENCDISISESQVSELPAFIADTIIMKNCNYSLEATEYSQYMCYSGIRCNRLEIDGGSISITNDCSNTINPNNFELNFIYGSNVTGYIKNCTINGAGSYRVSIIDSPYIEVATCDITLGNKASLCHYTTSTEKIYTALRDCTINYTASTYLTFGKITGCTFKNSSTGYTTDAYKLQVLCPAQITNNAFVGRSEMNFNGNKVLFTNNILQYSQSYTTFPTGSVNANNMVSG